MQPSDHAKLNDASVTDNVDDPKTESDSQQDLSRDLLRRIVIENVQGCVDVFARRVGAASPLSVEELSVKSQVQVDSARANRQEVLELLEQIRSEDGITLDLYQHDRLGYRIRVALRSAVEADWWGSAQVHRCDAEDRVGMRASDEINEAYPNDGMFSNERVFKRFVHLPGNNLGIKEEGTLFHLTFGAADKISSFRVFHQGHRDTLQVATYSAEQLISYLTTTSAEPLPEAKDLVPHFEVTKAEYLGLIARFNQFVGVKSVKLSLYEDDSMNGNSVGSPCLIADFLNIAPKQLGELSIELGIGEGLKKGSRTYFIWGTTPQGKDFSIDLQPRRSSNDTAADTLVDCDLQYADSTGIFFTRQPEQVIDIVTEYLKSR
jgi:hypothetical protein